MALDATVGGASSNSYGTLEEADDHFEDRPTRLDWRAVGRLKEAWLIAAADTMERLSYLGRRSYPDQALSFPRAGIVIDGVRLDGTEIPPAVQRAQFDLALWLSQQAEAAESTEALEAFERLKVDVIELVPRDASGASPIPNHVARSLAPFRAGASRYQFRIARG